MQLSSVSAADQTAMSCKCVCDALRWELEVQHKRQLGHELKGHGQDLELVHQAFLSIDDEGHGAGTPEELGSLLHPVHDDAKRTYKLAYERS
eukprot:COSAG06_NODE_3870_length_4815_cov_5.357294_2_plen_92_part_00